MDKNEVITLSSDDETDFTHCPKNNVKSSPQIQSDPEILKKYLEKCPEITIKKNIVGSKINEKSESAKSSRVPKKKSKMTLKVIPEVVDLEDCSEKTNQNSQVLPKPMNESIIESTENHSKLDVIDIDIDDVNENDALLNEEFSFETKTEDDTKALTDLPLGETCCKEVIAESQSHTAENSINKKLEETSKDIDVILNPNLKFFTEFVEYCGSLEQISNDRIRLMKKLMKKYGEADQIYINSEEFENLIKKCKEKVNVNNLYLMAKEITDELSFRKRIDVRSEEPEIIENLKSQENEKESINNGIVEINKKASCKKRIKFVNKIIKKLNKLGSKIRELEEQEVDLSDEEESVYVQLQRYRERFCQIHAKLCKLTDEIPDAERLYNRKICFTESRYPAINKCIETWLNKTKRFPDFSDVMKLLESQSSSLNLPPNKESIRAIAIEIFQQVGAMLQRRRRYDLWDSCCGFLNDASDPALSDPALDGILKVNYENRIKKENEIFQHFVELQEKEKLEPEEVPDEEANRSPVDSGNEDEKELEEIESFLDKKLDIAINNIEEDDDTKGNSHSDENKNDSENQLDKSFHSENSLANSKESKNDYKNCKSLKWRLGRSGKSNSENSNPGNENQITEVKKTSEPKKLDEPDEDKNDSDLELIAIKNVPVKVKSLKRGLSAGEEIPKKKIIIAENKNKRKIFDLNRIDHKGEKIEKNRVFDVQCCQIFPDVFGFLSKEKKNWTKRRVFRDLTNVKRLLEANQKKKKTFHFFSPFFFQRRFSEFEKCSWKKRFKVSFRLVTPKNQKCALNQNEKSGETLQSDSGKNERNVQDSSDRTGNEEGDFASSHGNGSEEDNNEDENKKNGRTDLDENQCEEDDEEEIETEEDNVDSEATDHSNRKTEPFLDVTYSESKDNLDENQEVLKEAPTLENTNEQTMKDDMQLEEAEKPFETLDEGSEMRTTSETDKSKDVVKKESTRVTESLGGNQKSRVDKSDLKETEDDMNESKSKEKLSKSEDSSLETEVPNCTVEVLEDKFEERSAATEASEKEKHSATLEDSGKEKPNNNITPSQNLLNAETEIKKKIKTSKIVKNCCKSERNFNSKVEKEKKITLPVGHKNEKANVETIKRETIELKPSTIRKLLKIDSTNQKVNKKSTSASDEERVKRFLLHSPSSISITPPRKLSLLKPPSQAALQALATLRNLKGISATIVRGGKPRSEDDVVVVGGSFKRNASQTPTPAKRSRNDLPVISSVQSIDCTTPKIVTVQGNVSGFGSSWPEVSNSVNPEFNTSSIRISKVWGSLPDAFIPSVQNSESVTPGCSSGQPSVRPNKVVKKKTAKKPVEYVVLE